MSDPGLTADQSEIQSAAQELADWLTKIADQAGVDRKPTRVHFGPGRLGNSLRRRSPAGFIIDQVSLQMLLPDGRLWSYTGSDAQRFPNGRYYDPRTDYADFAGSRSVPCGTQFMFLGAVIGKYTFGFADGKDSSSPHGLCAIVSEGRAVRYLATEQAMAEIANAIEGPGSDRN